MILFISPNPFKVKKREGYLQRVASIDGLFPGEEKHYYDDYVDEKILIDLMKRADMIYVHSIYQAHRILEYYYIFGEKIVTDLHGVVPEEESNKGNVELSDILTDTELRVFQLSNTFVAVTNAMVEYYNLKYKQGKIKTWIILPIFNTAMNFKEEKLNKTPKSYQVIYAGGAQPWQNIKKMIQAINTNDKYLYIILTHDIDSFKQIDKTIEKKAIIKSVKPEDVVSYYKVSQLGFILRDDSIINRVACPTKLIEYIGLGIVPIVDSPNIGDFKVLGYSYLTIDRFLNGPVLTSTEYERMVKHNLLVYKQLQIIYSDGVKSLKELKNSLRKNKKTISLHQNFLIKNSIKIKSLRAENEELNKQTIKNEKVIQELREQKRRAEQAIDSIINSRRYKWLSKFMVLIDYIRK